MEALGLGPAFWRDRHVFVTGQTGFKGSWLVLWLLHMGARVTGYALPPETTPSLFGLLALDRRCENLFANIEDAQALRDAMKRAQPSVVLHLAAQSLVRRSYETPLETFRVNTIGTANVLEAVRETPSVRSAVIVTTDKCYANDPPRERPFIEDDPLGGYDPYSASKACAELVTSAYRSSFFAGTGVVIATARAGNVIGGGDWSADRIVPDVVRSVESGHTLNVRNPDAVRPWQHVLEPLAGYLLVAQRAAQGDATVAQAWNFGPESGEELKVRDVVDEVRRALSSESAWDHVPASAALHEAPTLRLDSSKAQRELGWRPRLDTKDALRLTGDWYRRVGAGESAFAICTEQLESYVA